MFVFCDFIAIHIWKIELTKLWSAVELTVYVLLLIAFWEQWFPLSKAEQVVFVTLVEFLLFA